MSPIGMALCPECNQDFMRKNNQSGCSKECRRAINIKKNKVRTQFNTFKGSCGTKGAIQELKVSADLLRKGYQVFRSVSPSCYCDLVIISKEGIIKRVEVRSATKTKNGKFCFSREGKYDIIASVFKNEIQYEGLN